MSETCTRKLMAALPHAQVSLHIVSPADVALKAIGHVRAFRATAAERLWPLMAASLGGDVTVRQRGLGQIASRPFINSLVVSSATSSSDNGPSASNHM